MPWNGRFGTQTCNGPASNLAIGRDKTLQSDETVPCNQTGLNVTISRMSRPTFYRRGAEQRLAEALEDSPVVLIHGPRQCGKTTLAQYACTADRATWAEDSTAWAGTMPASGPGHRDYAYISFDDAVVRGGARADPAGFVADLPERVILDEVQHVPALFEAIKLEVDRRPVPGRFLLTGSTNVLLLPTLSESLAGRLQIVPLYPLTQRELANPAAGGASWLGTGFLNDLFGDGFGVRRTERLGKQLIDRIVAGGFPAALRRPTAVRQAEWHHNYIEARIQRDVRDLTRIRSLDVLPALLTSTASQTARLLNLSSLATPFSLSRPTIGEYVTLLERLFLLERLRPWHSNRLSRLIKTPKLHVGDTGLASALLGVDAASLAADRTLAGRLLETFAFQELRRQASWHGASTRFFHFRDKEGAEVDIVIERGARSLAGVEVKAGATVARADFSGLRKLARAAGEHFVRGVVLYDGEISTSFGERMYAVPVRRLWETA